MQRQNSNSASRRTDNGNQSPFDHSSGPSSRFPAESFVNSIVDAAAKADAEEKRRQPQNAERVYQACLPCKKRKTKCVRGDETNPDILPCARCRRQGKVAECVLAPRGPWPVGDARRPKEHRALHRASSSQAEGSSAINLSDYSPNAEIIDGGAWEDYVRPQRPNVPAFTTSTSGSAALDQLMSNVQDLRHAAPDLDHDHDDSTYENPSETWQLETWPPAMRESHREHLRGEERRRALLASFDTPNRNSSANEARYKFYPNDPEALLKLSAAERNAIPLEEARKLGPWVGLYTWDLRDWNDDDAMVEREMARRPYESAKEARFLRNDNGLTPLDADALNKACLRLDRRNGSDQAPNGSTSRQPARRNPSLDDRQSSAAARSRPRLAETPLHESRYSPSARRPSSDVRSDRGPPQITDHAEEDEVRLRLRILAVEKEELELQLRLHRLQGAKRRRLG